MAIPALLLCCSAAVLQPPAPGGSEPAPRVVGVDENGWPVFEAGGGAPPPGAVGERAPGEPRSRTAPERAPARAVLPLRSVLRDVFLRVGHPDALRQLGGVVAHCRYTAFDDGEPLATLEFVHEADLGHPHRDLVRWPDGRTLDARSPEVVLLGLALRAPWLLGGDGFSEVTTERPPDRGVDWLRFSCEAGRVTEVELGCDDATFTPIELCYRGAESIHGRVRFAEWRVVGAVELPLVRTLLTPDGGVAGRIEILRLEHGRTFPPDHFDRER